jgi:hypothetical protein
VRANRAFHLIVSRERPEPAFLAGPERHDRIEVVSIDDGEVVLFWELPARPAAKLVKELRTDLAGLGAEEFLARWDGADVPPLK